MIWLYGPIHPLKQEETETSGKRCRSPLANDRLFEEIVSMTLFDLLWKYSQLSSHDLHSRLHYWDLQWVRRSKNQQMPVSELCFISLPKKTITHVSCSGFFCASISQQCPTRIGSPGHLKDRLTLQIPAWPLWPSGESLLCVTAGVNWRGDLLPCCSPTLQLLPGRGPSGPYIALQSLFFIEWPLND